MQMIRGRSCMRKETIEIDILMTFRNGGRKIVQLFKITSGPATTMRKWDQSSK